MTGAVMELLQKWNYVLSTSVKRYLRIEIWFFDVHRVMNPVGGAKIGGV